MSQGEGIYTRSPADGPLLQGEILSNLPQARLIIESAPSEGQGVFDIGVHPWVIVMSQDCDLEQDYRARNGSNQPDKKIPNILFCEMTTSGELFKLIYSAGGPASAIFQRIVQNNDPRYQFLEKTEAAYDALGTGLDELCIDFKRYFTIPAEEVYFRLSQSTRRRCYLLSPYLEHLALRFYSYQSRVALPEEHQSE